MTNRNEQVIFEIPKWNSQDDNSGYFGKIAVLITTLKDSPDVEKALTLRDNLMKVRGEIEKGYRNTFNDFVEIGMLDEAIEHLKAIILHHSRTLH